MALGCLMLDLTVGCCMPCGRSVFHGEGFGAPKLRRGLLFSCGQQNGENY